MVLGDQLAANCPTQTTASARLFVPVSHEISEALHIFGEHSAGRADSLERRASLCMTLVF